MDPIIIRYRLKSARRVVEYLQLRQLNYRAAIVDARIEFRVFIDNCIEAVHNEVSRRLGELAVEMKRSKRNTK